jgi:hypothetical protein
MEAVKQNKEENIEINVQKEGFDDEIKNKSKLKKVPKNEIKDRSVPDLKGYDDNNYIEESDKKIKDEYEEKTIVVSERDHGLICCLFFVSFIFPPLVPLILAFNQEKEVDSGIYYMVTFGVAFVAAIIVLQLSLFLWFPGVLCAIFIACTMTPDITHYEKKKVKKNYKNN